MVSFITTQPAVVAQKQPQTICKQMDVAMFQESFIYKKKKKCGPDSL